MKAGAAAYVRRNRWAVSFADLALLLLGFFVLLQASNGRQQEIVSGVARQFGAPAGRSDRLSATALFQPGEAMLNPAGEARLAALAAGYAKAKGNVEIRSTGIDTATNRFDAWDLAAARTGAVARALTRGGVARDRIIVRGLDQKSENRAGQQIILALRPVGSPS